MWTIYRPILDRVYTPFIPISYLLLMEVFPYILQTNIGDHNNGLPDNARPKNRPFYEMVDIE